jgi:hypothetical protein
VSAPVVTREAIRHAHPIARDAVANVASMQSALNQLAACDPRSNPSDDSVAEEREELLGQLQERLATAIAERDAEIARLRALVETYQTVTAPRAGR